jgi:hypothetical protein
MNCKFCYQPIEELEQPEYFTIKKYECYNHPYRIRHYMGAHWLPKETVECTFFTLFKTTKVKTVVVFHESCTEYSISAINIIIEREGEYGDIKDARVSHKLISRFTCLPGLTPITPENIMQKIPTLITFS